MQTELTDFIASLKEKEILLSKDDKKNIHFQSIKNFLKYYDHLPNRNVKFKVAEILIDYHKILNENNWIFTSAQGKKIYFSHIMKVGSDYNHYLGFQALMGINGAIFGGILIDIVLLVTGVLRHIYFIPISTLLLVGYNRYLILSHKKKNKLYGPHY